MQHFLEDARLLKRLLAAVGVVAVDHDGGILQLPLLIEIREIEKVLVVIVGVRDALPVHITSEDRMRVGISVGMSLPAAIDEIVLMLRRHNTVHHDSQVSAGGILHADRALDGTGGQSVLLVLHAAGAHRHIAQKVVQVLVVFRIEHLVRADKSRLLDRAHMELPGGNNALEEVGRSVGIGLVDKPLVAVSGRPGFVRVNAGNDQNLVLNLLPQRHEPGNVVDHALLVIRRAGTDDQDELFAVAGEDRLELRDRSLHCISHIAGQRIHLLGLHGDWKFPLEIHVHHSFVLLIGSKSDHHFNAISKDRRIDLLY